MPFSLLLARSLCVFLFFFFSTPFSVSSSSAPAPDRFTKSNAHSLRKNASQEYIELTHPLPSDRLTPSCTLLVLHHQFGDTIGRPPVSVGYSPRSDCPPPWSHVALEMHVSSKGEQYDRIAGVWLDGAEILRTSTAEPTEDGVFWKFRKDVTRYTFLLQQSNLTLTVMLENIVNDVFTGVYDVSLTLLYYKSASVSVPSSSVADHHKVSRKLGLLKDYRVGDFVNKENKLRSNDDETGFESAKFRNNPVTVRKEAIDCVNGQRNSLNLYETPADLIIPISNVRDEGFWFRIESGSGVRSRGLRIQPNTRKAVLEVYVSFHGDDEFWYSNPPDSYIRMNNLTTGRGHGAYREVFVTIDGTFVGSVVPFPIIFTGGINPLLWEPVVAIGAFDLPPYDFDLTPFLGLLLDRKLHFFGLGVDDSIPFWLVDANLHLWFDHGSSAVQAKAVSTHTPALSIHRSSRFVQLDGSFKTDATRTSRFSGWVKSSAGNLTTIILHHFRFKNFIRFERNGTYKMVQQRIRTKTEVRVWSETGTLVSRATARGEYPLRVITSTLPRSDSNVYLMLTNVSHALREKWSHGDLKSSLYNSQDSWGWMVVKDHSVLSGSANTDQRFISRDEFGCFSRIVSATDGRLIRDDSTFICALPFQF